MSYVEEKTQIVHRDWRAYVKIARLDHWVKNVFVLPGAAFAATLSAHFEPSYLYQVVMALLATGLIASANYTINEYLDAEFDRFHPLKKTRPGAEGLLQPGLVWTQYACLAAAGIILAQFLGGCFTATAVVLLAMGIVYNVRPFRTKERVYIDVITESVNNPLRFLLGWFAIITQGFPPSSILISYWAGGAFLMGMKRYAEYRQISSPEVASQYRRSFAFYTERRLLVSSVFYALNSAFFLGIFLVKYRIEYILLFPFISLLFVEYMLVAMKDRSTAYAPEKLFTERRLMIVTSIISVLMIVLFLVSIPQLNFLLERVSTR